MNVKPIQVPGKHKTGELLGLSPYIISAILGFNPNISDDKDKVEYSWGFEVEGAQLGIWDYYGSSEIKKFSTYGDANILYKLFGAHYNHLGDI